MSRLTNLLTLYFVVHTTKGLLNDNFILVGDSGDGSTGLYQIDIDTGNTQQILPAAPSSVIGVAHNPRDGTFFYSDFKQKKIMKYSSRLGTTDVVLEEQNVQASNSYEGLALDHVNNKLYYTNNRNMEGRHIEGIVGEIDLATRAYRVYFRDGRVKPRAIQVDIKNGKLYFTDWNISPGTSPGIYELPVNGKAGSRISAIVTDQLHWPNGLVIDSNAGVMYWANVQPGDYPSRIEMANLNGTGRRVLLEERNSYYYGLALDSTYLYLTSYKVIRRINRFNYSISIVSTSRSFGRLYGIGVYSSGSTGEVAQNTSGSPNFEYISTNLSPAEPSEISTAQLEREISTQNTPSAILEREISAQNPSAIAYPTQDGPITDKMGSTSTIMETFNNPVIFVSAIVVIVTVIIAITVCCVVRKKRSRKQPVASGKKNDYMKPGNTTESLGFQSDAYAIIPADHFNYTSSSDPDHYLKLAPTNENVNNPIIYERPQEHYAKLDFDQTEGNGYLEPWKI